jgi:hypothetical protein
MDKIKDINLKLRLLVDYNIGISPKLLNSIIFRNKLVKYE